MEKVSTTWFRELIEEFRAVYKNAGEQKIPDDVEAIIILTADGLAEDENVDRTKTAIAAWKHLERRPTIYWNGVTEEQGYGPELVRKFGGPLATFQDCGVRGVANTKTQFEVMASDPRTKNLSSILLITSSYHVPRVLRTAGKFLSNNTKFATLFNENDYMLINVFTKTIGEIERIIFYARRGDILEDKREQ